MSWDLRGAREHQEWVEQGVRAERPECRDIRDRLGGRVVLGKRGYRGTPVQRGIPVNGVIPERRGPLVLRVARGRLE